MNNYDDLKNNIIKQATIYLNSADEFYPFGAAISKDRQIKPIGVYFEEEFVDSNKVFRQLELVIKKSISNGEYLAAAIGLDVYLDQKQPALLIKVYDQKNILDSYFLYSKKDGEYF